MATLKDLAKKCGVSTATVSYVMNNSPRKVLPATRAKVLKAAAEMGYQPNAYARALKGVRTPVIGVVFPHVTVPFSNVYFGPSLEGIVASATQRRMATMLFTAFPWEETEEGVEREFYGICDGFLLIAPKKDSRFARDTAERGIPIVSVGTQVDAPRVPSIDADNHAGGKAATQHLLELGHRRIAIIMCSDSPSPAWPAKPESHMPFSKDRRLGYEEALREWGIEPIPELEATIWDDSAPSRAAVKRLLMDERPTAIFGTNDGAAFRVVEACSEMGIRVPEDLSVVGFDDISLAAQFSPPLTTIRQPVIEIGANAVDMLCAQIEGAATDIEHRLMPVELIQRRSTAAI